MRTALGLATFWFGTAAWGQDLAAAPFSGEHVTLNRVLAAPSSVAPATVCEACAQPASGQYLGLDFLYWKATGPRNKFPLFEFNQLASTTTPAALLDSYGAGSFGGSPVVGLRGLWGRWQNADTAFEYGFLWLADFFHKRGQTGQTSSNPFTGAISSTQPVFVPTLTALDRYKVNYKLQNFGFEANRRTRSEPGCDTILGLRYHNLHERFSYTYDLPAAGATPDIVGLRESFHTTNSMAFVQLGRERSWALGEYGMLKAFVKGGIGPNLQGVRIAGPGGANGLLTAAGNQGYDDRFRVATLVDFGVSAAAQLTPNINASVGFGGMYFGGVARGANYIDQANARGTPVRRWTDDSLLLYGVTAALKFDY